MTGITLQTAGNGSFPMTTYLPPSTTQALNASKSGVQSLSVQTVHGAGYATIFSPPGATFPNGAYQLGSGGQQPLPQVSISFFVCLCMLDLYHFRVTISYHVPYVLYMFHLRWLIHISTECRQQQHLQTHTWTRR